MPINGTELISDPFNTTFKPFTDFFQGITGNGMIFFLFILVVLTIGLYIKTRKVEVPTLFMIGSGALLSSGSIFTGATDMAIAFIIFTALGFTALFVGLFFRRR